ncbi:MAG: hypothetical protein JNK72_00410 [Myxococcales bacterium]|nr:hypothetical protein [Myxococcales bacterium]
MPTTITPANGFDTATAITRPAPGERVGMETGPSPLAPLLQRFVDRDETLRLGLLGQMAGGDRMSVDPGGTSTVFTVRVSPIRAALIKDATNGAWRGVSLSAQTLGLSATAGPLAALAADTWYYITLAAEAGVPRLYINVFGPDDSLVWEAGMQDIFRYIGCFRTDAAGAPIPMRMHRGQYLYDFSATTPGGPLRVLNAGSATSFTAVSCAALVPPHARRARLCGALAPNAAGDTVSVRRTGATANALVWTAPTTHDLAVELEMDLDAARQFDYQVSTGSAAFAAVEVLGFDEG